MADDRQRPPTASPGPAGDGFRVVGIGASAGGLEACSLLLDAIADECGCALILVQHLGPTHESMMVELLARHTSLTVLQAVDGALIEAEHLYIIPPACFLVVENGRLLVTPTTTGQGARLPFDVLLESLARDCGERAVCVVLSGTGADGSVGLRAVRAQGGVVIVQEPSEADHDGMPRAAIATNDVDLILPVARIPEMFGWRRPGPPVEEDEGLSVIIDLLKTRAAADFSLYKLGTLGRRVERRMAMMGLGVAEKARYAAVLAENEDEIGQLAKDLLIHVTSFFRDAAVFALLSETIIPDLIRSNETGQPLRVWIAGCSTGEEAYSVAIVLREQLDRLGNGMGVQIFASDADAGAIAVAREGIYPISIENDVTPGRLAAFFVREDGHYLVSPFLRTMVVFAVQNLLADPPFGRLDLVSCRNVLIYLGSDAQRMVISLFHFALRPGGVLLLGTSESVGDIAGRFDVISKPLRVFRHIAGVPDTRLAFNSLYGMPARPSRGRVAAVSPSRRAALEQLCEVHALARHAPATVLTNHKHECLYSFGPTERYLRVAQGHASLDLLAMVEPALLTRFRSAILRAAQDRSPVVMEGGQVMQGGMPVAYDIEVHPVADDQGEQMLLVYFIDRPTVVPENAAPASVSGAGQVAALERDLALTRAELLGAVRSLEAAVDEQRAIRENALSVNEEYQSTNEELLTSKEELQSLNEELSALNSQLQETLDQQRILSDDLQNVLYSTDVATLFLDRALCIRLFTPATKALFSLIKSDVGRPLEDLRSLAHDVMLLADARLVLEDETPIEREVETKDRVWSRRVLPYRTGGSGVQGVVITFTEVVRGAAG